MSTVLELRNLLARTSQSGTSWNRLLLVLDESPLVPRTSPRSRATLLQVLRSAKVGKEDRPFGAVQPLTYIVTRVGGERPQIRRWYDLHPERERSLHAGVSEESHFSSIFPAYPRSLASVLSPRPAARRGSAFTAFRKSFRQNSAQNADEKIFRTFRKSAAWHLGAGHLASLRARVFRGQPGQIHTRRKTMELYANKTVLKGFVGKDAENFATKQQKTLVVFSLATKSGYKSKQTNEWVNRTEWHRIVVFGNLADIAKNLKKGDYVEVEGELQSQPREFDIIKDKKKTKLKVRDWEVRASKVTKLAKPASSHGENLDAEPITEDDAA